MTLDPKHTSVGFESTRSTLEMWRLVKSGRWIEAASRRSRFQPLRLQLSRQRLSWLERPSEVNISSGSVSMAFQLRKAARSLVEQQSDDAC